MKQFPLRIGEGWFDLEPPSRGVDIRRWRMWRAPTGEGTWTPFDTLRLDLTVSGDDLFAAFNSTTRNEVRRAERSDGLVVERFPGDLRRIDEVLAFYDRVGPQPGQRRPRRAVLRAFAEGNRLWLSRAVCAAETLVWHVYMVQEPTVLLLHSYSAFRTTGSNADRARFGRANRWLHWQDIRHFGNSCTVYDWGGYYGGETDAALVRIDAFKRAFGGGIVRLWERMEPVTVRGRLYARLRGTRRTVR